MASQVINFKISDFLNPNLLGKFIGPEGCNISRFEKEYKITLDLLKNNENESVLRITGQFWDLKMVIISIRSFITQIRNENNRYEARIPSKFIGFLIGKNGSKINEIKMYANVNVEIEKDAADFTKVWIIGSHCRILTALNMIEDRINSFGKENPYDDPRTRQFAEALEETW